MYARDGVEQACLGLQAACGADVNLLLFCCWMGSRRRSLGRRFLRRTLAAVSRWQSEVVQPLRRARRALKRDSVGGPGAWRAHLRANVAALELDAEYVEQLVLARLAAHAPRPVRNASAEKSIEANLERYLTLLGARIGIVSRRRLRVLCAACAPRRV